MHLRLKQMGKNILFAFLMLALSCNAKKEAGKLKNIHIKRLPQRGFCIEQNQIISANIRFSPDGYYIEGTKAVKNDSLDLSVCINDSKNCLVEKKFGPIFLQSDQVDKIKHFIEHHPKWQCEQDLACDACMSTTISINNKVYKDRTCCMSANPDYEIAFNSLSGYLDKLLE